jgi:hypothetical protein
VAASELMGWLRRLPGVAAVPSLRLVADGKETDLVRLERDGLPLLALEPGAVVVDAPGRADAHEQGSRAPALRLRRPGQWGAGLIEGCAIGEAGLVPEPSSPFRPARGRGTCDRRGARPAGPALVAL